MCSFTSIIPVRIIPCLSEMKNRNKMKNRLEKITYGRLRNRVLHGMVGCFLLLLPPTLLEMKIKGQGKDR